MGREGDLMLKKRSGDKITNDRNDKGVCRYGDGNTHVS